MAENKKIHYGDNQGSGTAAPPTPSPDGDFTFDRMDIDFSSMTRTFDEL